MYKFELFIDEQVAASGEFEIVDSRLPSEGPFGDLRQSLPWNTWPPSIDEEKALSALLGLMEIDPSLATLVASRPWVQRIPTEEGRGALQLFEILAREDLDLAKRVIGFSWLADDVTKDEWLTLRTLTLLAVRDAAWANFISEFDWLNDGITEDERSALADLHSITIEHLSLAETLLSLPWLGDQLTKLEEYILFDFKELMRRDSQIAQQVADMRLLDGPVHWNLRVAIWTLWKLYDKDPDSLSSLSARPWFSDGLDDEEANIVADLGYIAAEHPSVADTLLSLPWLRHSVIGDLHIGVFRSLKEVLEHDPNWLEQLTSQSWYKDGMTDEEAALIVVLRSVIPSEELFQGLIQDGHVTSDTILLPSIGEVKLFAVRRSLFQPDADMLDGLAQAIRVMEELIGVPWKKTAVIVLWEPEWDITAQYRPSAENAWTHIVMKKSTGPLLHEMGHYYWRTESGVPRWFSEGGANFFSVYVSNQPYITTPEHVKSWNEEHVQMCKETGIDSLQQLIDKLDEVGSEKRLRELGVSTCFYSLSTALFLHLYDTIGGEAFGESWKDIYLKGNMLVRHLTEEEIYEAFHDHTPSDRLDEFKRIYKQWHGGRFIE